MRFLSYPGVNNLFVDLLNDVFRKAERKLAGATGASSRTCPENSSHLPGLQGITPGTTRCSSEFIKAAIVHQNAINIHYRTGLCDYTVQSLTLLHHKDGLYLVARALNHEQPAYYNIKRLR